MGHSTYTIATPKRVRVSSTARLFFGSSPVILVLPDDLSVRCPAMGWIHIQSGFLLFFFPVLRENFWFYHHLEQDKALTEAEWINSFKDFKSDLGIIVQN